MPGPESDPGLFLRIQRESFAGSGNYGPLFIEGKYFDSEGKLERSVVSPILLFPPTVPSRMILYTENPEKYITEMGGVSQTALVQIPGLSDGFVMITKQLRSESEDEVYRNSAMQTERMFTAHYEIEVDMDPRTFLGSLDSLRIGPDADPSLYLGLDLHQRRIRVLLLE